MLQTTTQSKTPWILGLSLGAVVLTLATSWGAILQIALLGVAIYQLTQKPTKKDRILLLIACAVIALSLAWLIATTLVTYGFSSDVDVTSVPLN